MSDDIKVKILVCDDDLTARILMKETLASDSIEVIEAENGQRAIEQFEKHSPALLLLDVSMPKMNGFAGGGGLCRLPYHGAALKRFQ